MVLILYIYSSWSIFPMKHTLPFSLTEYLEHSELRTAIHIDFVSE
jgi:hypothetical protein